MSQEQHLKVRSNQIIEMLCDCMSVSAAEAERPNIIKLINQGKTDQEIYQAIAWD
ncbi:hypothetical protein [Phaeodactylibacter xiamenensis]|uniref:hypothetical protein n=1 Tax=Phaeodactylibacter xiamenensis TaxID=1524460 RepID=UPI0024A9BFA1|nr:hypothetical protein [Phaeodactylibacter xiamenensis]